MPDKAEKKYTLRIPEELHAQLEEQARKERRSLHGQILVMLQAGVEQAAMEQARKSKKEEERG